MPRTPTPSQFLFFLTALISLFSFTIAHPQGRQTSTLPENTLIQFGTPQPTSTTSSFQPLGTLATFSPSNITSNVCSFNNLQDFFDYAHLNNLNITLLVEKCQNLCVLSYGYGNPDLSGIGMMYAYSIQVALTIIFGPIFQTIYRLLPYLPWKPKHNARKAFASSADIQIVFFEANGFLIISSAVAAVVRISQKPTIFEIAEIQVLMFVQVNSLLIIFFCLVHPIARWWQRFFQFLVGFVTASVALSLSQLGRSASLRDWEEASLGCETQKAFKTITPVPYPGWVVGIFALFAIICFVVQSLSVKYPHFGETHRRRIALRVLSFIWGVIVLGSIAGLFLGLAFLWRQRNELRSVAGIEFQDDQWGFGQVAALFIWIPIPVEISYRLNDWLEHNFPKWYQRSRRCTPSFIKEEKGSNEGTSFITSTADSVVKTLAVESEREVK